MGADGISFSGYRETAFTKPIKRSVLRDVRISLGARALFMFLADLPDQWVFRARHLQEFTRTGRTQFEGYIRELRAVGAISLRRVQLTADDAARKNQDANEAGAEKKFHAGQIVGTTWQLNHPDEWAQEIKLNDNDSENSVVTRESRNTGKPCYGKPATKVLQSEGSAINKKSSGEQAAAALWIIENSQDQILEDELLAALPGGRAELNAEAATLIKAGKRPYLSTIQKSIATKNKKEAAARRQAEQAASRPALSPDEKTAQLRAANLRGALRQEQNSSV